MEKYKIIVPVHEFNKDVSELLKRCLNSVPENIGVIVVTSCENLPIDKVYSNVSYVYIKTDKKENFATLVNAGFNEAKKDSNCQYASILEYDDEFNAIWFEEVEKEISDKPDVSVFLPLTEIIDFNTNKFLSYGNEAPWASSFSSEIGYIDNESLQQFFDFYLTGSVFNLKDWNYINGLKESIRLSFWYEFLLRLTHNGKKAYVIPKLGYKHYVNRKDALHIMYQTEMSEEESQWWYNLALEEYTYKKDRKKEYKTEK